MEMEHKDAPIMHSLDEFVYRTHTNLSSNNVIHPVIFTNRNSTVCLIGSFMKDDIKFSSGKPE
jgi:hypothetical protein